MIECIPLTAPEQWQRWEELAPQFQLVKGMSPSDLLAWSGLIEVGRLFQPTLCIELLRCRNALLTALVEAGRTGQTTGWWRGEDENIHDLRASHWIALYAGGAGRLHQVVNLALNWLTIDDPDGTKKQLTGIDLDFVGHDRSGPAPISEDEAEAAEQIVTFLIHQDRERWTEEAARKAAERFWGQLIIDRVWEGGWRRLPQRYKYTGRPPVGEKAGKSSRRRPRSPT